MLKLYVGMENLKSKVVNKLKEKSGNQWTTFLGLIIVAVVIISVVVAFIPGAVNELAQGAIGKIKTLFAL